MKQWRIRVWFDDQQLTDQVVTHFGKFPVAFSIMAPYVGEGRLDARYPGQIRVEVHEMGTE